MLHSEAAPAAATADAASARLELTVRGLVLGAVITLVFTAANVYLGLKVGLTFASSIPAAVISMAILRMFKTGTIYENNIVQTVASAAGTISSIIFVLPGLVMVGWWSGFPFWPAFGVCVVGGVLGVMFTIPLRRALVTTSDLPYPEGVAAAEVLRVGTGSREGAAEGKAGLLAVIGGGLCSAAFACVAATRVFASEIDYYFRAGASASGIGFPLSFALLGAGHLIGLAVGIAFLVGAVIAWGIFVPILTALHPAAGDAATVATTVWSHQVRFIGAGAIGISAIWSLARLAIPVWTGLLSAIEASRRRSRGQAHLMERTEQDIPITLVAIISIACLIPMAALLVAFLHGGSLGNYIVPLVIASVIYVVVIGFIVAAVAGYMAGLIGSLEQSGIGSCDSGDHRHLAAHPARCAWCERIDEGCARRIRTVRHRRRPERRDDRQRQLARPQDGPTRRCDALAAASCANRRRAVRLARDSARAERAQSLVRFRRRPARRCGRSAAARTAGNADFNARKRRHQRQHQLGNDFARRAGRDRHDRHRRSACAPRVRANANFRRLPSGWRFICRRRRHSVRPRVR